ncbi:putative homing endonuclease [Bodo saltans virus]|uniref:Homing endonuclease n=1 Tax=Bodo saltans virus TaxID=2024608 RepID=A0A2H4UV68_9VIRU|nr:putative homing endonuclease [Bodo saltans virus]ATZ80754.1 putative homing endonuclease [Bodo saltans virus]
MEYNYKCFSSMTPIMKYDTTIVPVDNLKVNDILIGANGKPAMIKNIYRKTGKLYTITPTNGIPYTTSEEHILMLKSIDTEKKIKISVAEFNSLQKSEQAKLYSYKTKLNFIDNDAQKVADFFKSKFPDNSALIDVFINTEDIPKELLISSFQMRYELITGFVNKIGEKTLNVYKLPFSNWTFANKFAFIARSVGFRVFVDAFISNNPTVKKNNIVGNFFVTIADEGYVKIPTMCHENINDHRPLLSEITIKYYGTDEYIAIEIENDANIIFVDCTVL